MLILGRMINQWINVIAPGNLMLRIKVVRFGYNDKGTSVSLGFDDPDRTFKIIRDDIGNYSPEHGYQNSAIAQAVEIMEEAYAQAAYAKETCVSEIRSPELGQGLYDILDNRILEIDNLMSRIREFTKRYGTSQEQGNALSQPEYRAEGPRQDSRRPEPGDPRR